ncbi:MAG: DNA translocase FtsK [Chlorobi bacterium]|nr:DNA translocase FtsK [Chlorobiota bacterium]
MVKEKKTDKRSVESNNKKSKLKAFNKSSSFFKDEKIKIAFGLIFIAIAIYLTIAMISYFFTWKVDQSKLDVEWNDFIFNSNVYAENWAGKTGAYFSYLFMHKWFGIASFFIVYIIGIISFKLLKLKIVSIWKSIKYSILIAIWLSLILGFIFYNSKFLPGGLHGYYLSKWLISIVGKAGTAFVIILYLFIFIIFAFKNSLQVIKSIVLRIFARSSIENIDFSDEIGDENLENVGEENNGSVAFDVEETKINNEINKDTEDEFVVKETLGDENDELKLSIENSRVEEKADKISNKPVGNYDPTLDLSTYKMPPIDLLKRHDLQNSSVTNEELISNKNKIVETLLNYKIEIDKIKATIGPTVTLYEIVPAPGVRISKIKNLEDDIALSLSALGIRIIAPIPGKGTIGIEVPNLKPEIVSMHSIISSKKFQETKFELPIGLGKTISNEAYVIDLTKMPHLLIAGATGQGKSVGLNAVLTSLLYKKHPAQLKFVLVDPKKVELTLYTKLEKHFLAMLPGEEEPIITDTQKVVNTLNSLTMEMDSRYELLKKARTRNIKEYNFKFIERSLNPENGHRYLPYIVVVIDEFADLIMTAGKEVEMPLARLAQLARAIGIHLVIATQRPTTNIITGLIKANFPARIAFRVMSSIDSRTILDSPGANQLIGRGDMLIAAGNEPIRVQCAFIDTPEIDNITEYITKQQSYPSAFMLPEYVDEGSEKVGEVDLKKRDALFEDAARLLVATQQGSTSLIQRKFSIGYNRAGRIIDQLEAAGVVGSFEGSKARQVLIPDDYSLEQLLNRIDQL